MRNPKFTAVKCKLSSPQGGRLHDPVKSLLPGGGSCIDNTVAALLTTETNSNLAGVQITRTTEMDIK